MATTRTATVNNTFVIPQSDNSFNYDTVGRSTLSDLMNGMLDGNVADGEQVLSILKTLVKKTMESDTSTWQKYQNALANGERYPSTHKQSVYHIKLVAARTQQLYERAQSFIKAGRKATPEQKEALTSHDVLKETYNKGKLSFYDLWALLYGKGNGVDEKGKVNPRRHGLLANLQPNQAAILSHNEGYRIRYNRVDYLVSAETVHQMIYNMGSLTLQDAPYGGRCVMVMGENTLMDGKTMIIQKGSFTGVVEYASPTVLEEQGLVLGQTRKITYKPMRLSLDFSTYKTLYMSQFSGRYGKEGFEVFATILETYFGDSQHLPENRYEAKWFQDLCLALVYKDATRGYQMNTEAAVHAKFLPFAVFGLRGITEEVLFNKIYYISQMKEQEELARQRREEGTSGGAALRQFATPKTPEDEVAAIAAALTDHPF